MVKKVHLYFIRNRKNWIQNRLLYLSLYVVHLYKTISIKYFKQTRLMPNILLNHRILHVTPKIAEVIVEQKLQKQEHSIFNITENIATSSQQANFLSMKKTASSC